MAKKESFRKAFDSLLKVSASQFGAFLPKDMECLNVLTVKDAMVNAQIIKALKGDIHSFGLIREIIGEKAQEEKSAQGEIVIKLEGDVKKMSI